MRSFPIAQPWLRNWKKYNYACLSFFCKEVTKYVLEERLLNNSETADKQMKIFIDRL